MDVLTLDRFTDHVGGTFDTAAGGATLPLTLEAAEPISNAMREGGGFRLQWLGPPDPILPQATYRMAVAGEEHEIFIVPISRDEGGTRYEAVFN